MSEIVTVVKKLDISKVGNIPFEDTIEILMEEINDLIECGEISEGDETTIRLTLNTLMTIYKKIIALDHYPSIIQKVIQFQKLQYDEALKEKDLSLGKEYRYKLFNLFYIKFLSIIGSINEKPSISKLVR